MDKTFKYYKLVKKSKNKKKKQYFCYFFQGCVFGVKKTFFPFLNPNHTLACGIILTFGEMNRKIKITVKFTQLG